MEEQINTFIMLLLPFYLTSFCLYFVRVLKGPTIPDIVLAIDALSFDIVAFIALLSVFFKSLVLVPVATLFALWVYSLDIFVAKYLEKKEMGD